MIFRTVEKIRVENSKYSQDDFYDFLSEKIPIKLFSRADKLPVALENFSRNILGLNIASMVWKNFEARDSLCPGHFVDFGSAQHSSLFANDLRKKLQPN